MMVGNGGEMRRNWPIVLGAFIGISGGFASLYFYTAGLFIKPMQVEFGWSRGQASLGAIATVVGVVAFPLAGRLVDRFGETRVALYSGLGLAVSFACLGYLVTDITSFVLLVALLTFLAAGTLPIGYNRLIVRNFNRQRGLALGLGLTGTAIGSIVVAPVLAPFIGEFGWRDGYYALALLTLAFTAATAAILRGRGDERAPQSGPVQSSAKPPLAIMGHPAFRTTSAMIFLSATAVLGTTTHIVPLLTDHGMNLVEAGAVASALGISVILGRLATGYLLDKWDAGVIACILFLLAACGTLALAAGGLAFTLAGALLVGFGVGTEGDLLAYLLGRRFPARQFGSVYGAIFGVHALGGALGGLLAGASFDWAGSYDAWLVSAAMALTISAIIAYFTERGVMIEDANEAS